MRRLFAFAAALTLAALALVAGAAPTKSECASRGFTASLQCSSCAVLKETVADDSLFDECKECCAEESAAADAKQMFARAVVEVCSWRLKSYPHLVEFAKHVGTFKNVVMSYVSGAPPTLRLYDAEGSAKEIINIDHWKTEDMDAFLRARVAA